MSQYMSFAIAAVFLILSLFVVFFFFKFITEGRLRRAENTTSSAYIQKLEFRLKHIDVLEEYIKRLFSHTQQLELRLKPIVNLEEEIQRLNGIIHQRTSEIEALRASYDEKKSVYDLLIRQVAIFDEKLSFAEMGVYEPHFDFTDSEEYKKLATEIRSRQKSMISQNTAVICTKKWTLDGSLAKGQTMINRNIRLTLRAFNNECDYVIANARWNNVNSMEKRIINAKVQINKMNDSHSICVIDEYLNLKIKELYLTHEYREKIKFEQDERAQMARLAREEQKFVRDMERAEEDEARYERLLSKAKAEANIIAGPQLEAFNDQIRMLEEDLAKAQAKVIRAQAMAERTRSGFVYIISNIGASCKTSGFLGRRIFWGSRGDCFDDF